MRASVFEELLARPVRVRLNCRAQRARERLMRSMCIAVLALGAIVCERSALGKPYVPNSPHYYGGPLLSHVEVVSVFWGSNVEPAVQSGIGPFVSAYVSTELAGLQEYSAPGYNIGSGTFAGNFTIAPSTSGTTVSDQQITDEIELQIACNHLPPPNANTLYLVHLPQDYCILSGDGVSCDKWPYHYGKNAIHSVQCGGGGASVEVGRFAYAVVPDFLFSGFPFNFNWYTGDVSDMISGAIVDPYPSRYYPFPGWYPEPGDNCQVEFYRFSAGGVVYVARQTWSEIGQACSSAGLLWKAEAPEWAPCYLHPTKPARLTISSTSGTIPLSSQSVTVMTTPSIPFHKDDVAPNSVAVTFDSSHITQSVDARVYIQDVGERWWTISPPSSAASTYSAAYLAQIKCPVVPQPIPETWSDFEACPSCINLYGSDTLRTSVNRAIALDPYIAPIIKNPAGGSTQGEQSLQFRGAGIAPMTRAVSPQVACSFDGGSRTASLVFACDGIVIANGSGSGCTTATGCGGSSVGSQPPATICAAGSLSRPLHLDTLAGFENANVWERKLVDDFSDANLVAQAVTPGGFTPLPQPYCQDFDEVANCGSPVNVDACAMFNARRGHLAQLGQETPQSFLVTSSGTHSVEQFRLDGNWARRFADLGSRTPYGIAQSPTSGAVFVTTFEGFVRRYTNDGQPLGEFSIADAPGKVLSGITFDSLGNLYVATYDGTAGNTQKIYMFLASALLGAAPVPFGSPIVTGLQHGDQLAIDPSGNICIPSFADQTVRCFSTATGAMAFDYGAQAGGFAYSPDGIAFDEAGRLFASNIVSGAIVSEEARSQPVTTLAQGLEADLRYVSRWENTLYVPSYRSARTGLPDLVYAIDVDSGSARPLITSHLSAPYHAILAQAVPPAPVAPTPMPALPSRAMGLLAMALLITGGLAIAKFRPVKPERVISS